MTDRIHLTEVRLSNFRSFGQDRVIPLAPGPSVLVVAGSNGLGKTTLIEAIEWALTGTVRRFQGKKPEDVNKSLTRSGAPPNSHQVKLTFGDHGQIARGRQHDPARSDVVALLADPNWPHRVSDLSAYLGLTHFLSQSPTLRLTSRDSKARWEDLSQLTGAVRVDRMVEMLGPGTKRRMTQATREAEAEQQRLEETRGQLAGKLEALRELNTLLSAAEAYPADQVIAEGQALLQQLRGATGITTTPQPDASGMLQALTAAILTARQALAARRASLERAREQVGPWIAAKAESGDLESRIAGVSALHRAVSHVYQTQTALDQWEKRRALLKEMSEAREASDRAGTRVEDCRKNVAAAVAAQRDLDTLHTRLAEADEAVRIEEGGLASWRALVEEEQAVQADLRAVAEQEPARAAAVEAQQAALRQQQALLARYEEARLALSDAEAERGAAAEAVAGRAAHLSELIKTLHEADTECPFCLTTHEDGALLARARRALERQDPALRAATERVAARREDQKASLTALVTHDQALRDATATARGFEERRLTAEHRADALRSDFRVGGRPLAGLAEWLAGRVAASGADVERRRRERHAIDPEGTLADRRHRAAEAVRHATEALEVAEQADREAKGRYADLHRQALFAVPDSIEMNPAAVGAEKARARAALEEAHRNLADAERAVNPPLPPSPEGRPLALWVKANLDDLSRQQIETTARMESCHRVWTEAGLPDEPSLGVCDQALHSTTVAEGTVASIDTRNRELRSGHDQWLKDRRRQHLEQEISKLVAKENALDVDTCLADLEQRVKEAGLKAGRFAKARTALDKVSGIVEEKQARFLQTIVDPLQARANEFAYAWTSYPDRMLEMRHNRQTRASKGELGLTVMGHDAELCLSEGQAGVNALSFLLAASTAHAWSRWRGLMLDDPLQYNDLVHKAAFLDLLRPLVLAQGYQVILSTHDLEEARFIERKCRNASIPFALCRMNSVSDKGVLYSMSKE